MTCIIAQQDIMIIIPYQELLGNYDPDGAARGWWQIIPYQELLGNYDLHRSDAGS